MVILLTWAEDEETLTVNGWVRAAQRVMFLRLGASVDFITYGEDKESLPVVDG